MTRLAEGIAGAPPWRDPESSELTGQFWFRLVLCLGIAVGLSWWLIHYTDWFEVIISLFGLTGLFALLGVVLAIVPPKRAEKIKQLVTAWLWEHPKASLVLLGVFLIGFCVSLLFGTLQLESVQGEYLVWISPAGTSPEKEEQNQGNEAEAQRVPAGGRLREVKWASWLAGEYRVRVSGFPELRLAVSPWWRQDRQLPYSFLRPVVLIWPERNLAAQLRTDSAPAQLVVLIDDEAFLSECKGESIWIGYTGDMMVPKHVRESWQGYQNEPGLLGLLLQPRALGDRPKDVQPGQPIPGTSYTQSTNPIPRALQPGQKIQGILYRVNGKEADASTAKITVRSVQESADMVQPVPLLLGKKI